MISGNIKPRILGTLLVASIIQIFTQHLIAEPKFQVAPLLAEVQLDRLMNEKAQEYIATIMQYAQQNKLYTPALQQLQESLTGKRKIENLESLYDGLREFSSVVALMHKLPKDKCYNILIQEVKHGMEAFDKQLKSIDQQIANADRVKTELQTLESLISQSIATAITQVVPIQRGIPDDSIPTGGKRSGTNKLIVGDGAGNNVLTVTNTGDLTLRKSGSGAETIKVDTASGVTSVTIGSTSGSDATTLQSGTGDLNITGGGTISIDSTNALSLNSSGAEINVGNDNVNKNINIATAGTRTVTVGSSAATTNVLGATNINTTGTATTSIGTSTSGSAVHIADSTATGAVTIGNATGKVGIGGSVSAGTDVLKVTGTSKMTDKLTVDSGGVTVTAGGLTVSADGATITGTTGITGATTITGVTTINTTGTAATSIGTSTSGSAVHIADSTATGAVTIGNATGKVGIGGSVSAGTDVLKVTGTSKMTDKLTVDSGGVTVTAGGLTVTADGATITGTTGINSSGTTTTTIGNSSAMVNVAAGSGSTYKQADGTYAAPSYTFSNSTGGTTTGNYYYSDTTRISATVFTVKDTETFNVNQGPSIAFMNDSTFAIAYTTATSAGTYFQRYNANYTTNGTAVQVDTGNVADANSGAAIAYDASRDYIIVAWVKADGGVYVRPYKVSDGTAVNAAVLVSTGFPASATGAWPSLAVEGDGTIGVFWQAAATDNKIYGNTVSTSWSAGTPQDLTGGAAAVVGGGQSAAYIGGTKAVVCWKKNADSKLYYNTYDTTTSTAGTPALVQDTLLDATDAHGAVAAIRFGNVIFTYKTGAASLHEKILNNTFTATVKDDTELTSQAAGNQFSVAADGLSFVVEYSTTDNYLKVANYDSGGIIIGTAQDVLATPAASINGSSRPAIALCGGNCIASWYRYHATVPEAVDAQAFSLKGMGVSTIGGRSWRTNTIGASGAIKNTTDIYGALNVTGGDITTSGNLNVNGRVNLAALTMSGNLTVNGDICATGSVSVNQATCPSDRRIKTNVTQLDLYNCLNAVNQLRPVSYNFTPEFIKQTKAKDVKQIGLIAQDVEVLIPEVVSPMLIDGQDLRGISYERLVPYLICSIQLLNKKIELLESTRSN